MNRLRTASSPNKRSHNIIPSLPPTSDEVIDNLEEKLQANSQSNSIKQKAGSILLSALNELETRVPEIHKPESLSRIAETMNKIVSTETEKSSGKGNSIGQIIIYAPERMREEQFETIDISHRE